MCRVQWQAAAACSSAAERRQLCERVFVGGEEELGLLEALKLLMLGSAVELHGCMAAGGDVPLFCWLLFARDSSDGPRSFLSNHLSHVGLGAGLEQVGREKKKKPRRSCSCVARATARRACKVPRGSLQTVVSRRVGSVYTKPRLVNNT